MPTGVPGSNNLPAVVKGKNQSALSQTSGSQKKKEFKSDATKALSGTDKAAFPVTFLNVLGEVGTLAGRAVFAEEGLRGLSEGGKKTKAGTNAEAAIRSIAGPTGLIENRQGVRESATEGRLSSRTMVGGQRRESSREASNTATTADRPLSKTAGRLGHLLLESVEEGGNGEIKAADAAGLYRGLGATAKADSRSTGMKKDAGARTMPGLKAGDREGPADVKMGALPAGNRATSSGKVSVKAEGLGRRDEPSGDTSQVSAADGTPGGKEEQAASGKVKEGDAKGFKDQIASYREQVKTIEGSGGETPSKELRLQVDAKSAPQQKSYEIQVNHGLSVEAKEPSSAAAKETQSRPVSPQVVIDRIAENGHLLLRAGSGRVRLTLTPPQLGTLDVDLRVSRDRLKMVLTAENGEVRQILQSNMDQLKSTLQGQGWNLERMDVVVQDQYGKDLGQPDQGSRYFGGDDPGRGRGDGGRESGSFQERYQPGCDDTPFLNGDGMLSVFV